MNFFRDHIPNCAEISLLLFSLVKQHKPEKIKWTEAAKKALNDLKESVKSDRCLHPPDSSKPYQLFTDASYGAIGSWLGQYDSSGCLRPIAFASKKL